MEPMPDILKNFSTEDIERLKLFLSILPSTLQTVKEIVTLRVFVEEYCNFIKQNRSIAYYKSVVNACKHLTNYFGQQKAVQSICLKDIENFISYLQHQVPKGFRVYYRTLKAAFNKAKDWDYVKENYFLKVKLPKKQQIYPAYINELQLHSICGKIVNEIIKEIVIVAFYSGMRLNELLSLHVRNVDLEKRIITVGGIDFTTKCRSQRFIPMSDEVYKILLGRFNNANKHDDDFVFCKPNGQRFSGDHVSKTFKKACTATGMDNGIHYHSIRHSTASYLVQRGVNLYVVKELLGHKSISTTESYSHLNIDSLKGAIQKFDESY